MVTLMYKNTHTQNKNSAKKKKRTNKQITPPPAKKKQNIFVFCLNLLQDAKIPFRFFI